MLALAALLGVVGCGDDTSGSGSGGGGGGSTSSTTSGGDQLDGVVYEGTATDEGLVELLASTPVDDASQAAQLVEPTAGTPLDPATVLDFTWAVGPTARLAPAPGSPHRTASHRAATRRGPAPVRVSSWLEKAAGVVFDVREAHAHGDPMNGRAYLLVFSTAPRPALLRVFTTNLAYTPDAAAWATLTGAGAPVTVTITGAIFEQNRVTQDGGPWVGPAVVLGE